ncbi:MAG: hypothetical protein B6I29_03905 [Marinitoga sp. 4572_148]|nr:MAG: hypothetical protein B6I29_03905 [Marinitoga sp. 4572_148]
MEENMRGKVKWFDAKKGYGFISGDQSSPGMGLFLFFIIYS